MSDKTIGQSFKRMTSSATNLITRKEKKTNTKTLDSVIISSIVLVFFLCPLFFTNLVARGMGFEKMILFYFLVLLGIVAWVTKGIINGELNIKRTPLDWPILAVIILFIISTVLSINLKDSLIGTYGNLTKSFVAIIIFSLFYYLAVNNLNLKRIKISFWALIISSSILIVYTLAQLLGHFILPFAFTKAVTFNPIGSLTSLTMFLVIVLPLFLVATTQLKEIHPRLNKGLAIIIKILMIMVSFAGLIILALLNGFVFWPVALVGVIIVLMFFLAKIINVSTNNLIIPLTFFILLVVLLVLGNFNIMDLNLPAEVSLSRGISWDIAKNSLKSNPIFGSGPATFYYDFSKFKGSDFNASILWNTRFNNASGLFFESLATVGTLGTLGLIIIFLISLSISFLALIKITNKEVHSILLGLFASFISVIIFATLFSLSNALILLGVLISTLAVAVAIIVYPERFQSLKLSFRSSPKYALALAAIFLTVSAGVVILFTMGLKMYIADTYARQSLLAESLEEKVDKLSRAVKLFPYEDGYYMTLANNYIAIANQEAVAGQDQAKIENNLSLAIETAKRAVRIAPTKAINIEALALIYENASFYTRGALEWADNLYNDVIALEPDNPVPHLRMALINMARSNAEEDATEKEYYINEAIKKYDEAISKKDDLSPAYYGKAVAYEKLGNNDEAIEQLKKAVILDRNNIDYRFELGRMYFNRGVTGSNLSQDATRELVEGEEGDELSVDVNQSAGGTVSRNDDLRLAEQVFFSIYQLNPSHANALYSLGLLYQKIGERDNARNVIKVLLEILSDEGDKQTVKDQFPGLY